jgi:hypothetical protein
MYNEKYLLFTSKKGDYKTTDNVYDPLTWTSTEAVLYPASTLLGMKPASATTIDMSFDNNGKMNTVTLDIKNGNHVKVMSIIGNSIATSKQSIITVADVLGHVFIHKDVYGATIKTSTPILYYNKITNATQVNVIPINTKTQSLTSMTLANIHSGDASVTVFLSNPTDNWYIIKDLVIPTGSTLKLESDELDYDADIFNLYVKLGGSTPVDVIVR